MSSFADGMLLSAVVLLLLSVALLALYVWCYLKMSELAAGACFRVFTAGAVLCSRCLLCKDVMYICLSSCTHAKCVVVFCDVAYQPLVNYLPSSKGYVLLRLLENYWSVVYR